MQKGEKPALGVKIQGLLGREKQHVEIPCMGGGDAMGNTATMSMQPGSTAAFHAAEWMTLPQLLWAGENTHRRCPGSPHGLPQHHVPRNSGGWSSQGLVPISIQHKPVNMCEKAQPDPFQELEPFPLL